MVLAHLSYDTKRVQGIFTVILAVFFLMAPVLDGFLCGGEGAAQSVSQDVHQVSQNLSDGTADGHQPSLPDDNATCLHGHCHHTVSEMGPGSIVLDIPQTMPKLAGISVYLSPAIPYSIDRPPRV